MGSALPSPGNGSEDPGAAGNGEVGSDVTAGSDGASPNGSEDGLGDRRGGVAARAERIALHLLARHGRAADRRTGLGLRDGSGEDQDGGEEGTFH